MKEVFNNLANSTDETREEVLKQLLKKMGKKELEEWIKNSDMSEEFKQKMLADMNKILRKFFLCFWYLFAIRLVFFNCF
jgi:hypothetical protein